jgi:hypothetical protein
VSGFPDLHAIIGVWNRAERTYHVRRSALMENYPGVWSLLSIQVAPEELPDPTDLAAAQAHMGRMAVQRLNGARIDTVELLSSDSSDKNPIGKNVHLHLYRIELDGEPELSPAYYSEGRWMTFEEYEHAASDSPCGLCMRMWGDYAFLHGIIDHPFIPGRK